MSPVQSTPRENEGDARAMSGDVISFGRSGCSQRGGSSNGQGSRFISAGRALDILIVLTEQAGKVVINTTLMARVLARCHGR